MHYPEPSLKPTLSTQWQKEMDSPVKPIETVEILLELIKQSLESGGDVLISGFGKFCVKQKAK
jgi:integration host factor subunit alpha